MTEQSVQQMELHKFLRFANELDPSSKSVTFDEPDLFQSTLGTILPLGGQPRGITTARDPMLRTKFLIPSQSLSLLEKTSRVSVLSSRLSQKLEQCPVWFDALRTLGGRWVRDQVQAETVILTAEGTTADLFMRRLGELFGVRILVLTPIPKRFDKKRSTELLGDRVDRIFISQQEGQKRFPADQWLAMLSHQCYVLAARSGGNVLRAVNARLKAASSFAGNEDGSSGVDKQPPGDSTRILIDRKLTPKKTEQALMRAGAAGWWLSGKSKRLDQVKDLIASEDLHASELPVPVLDFSEVSTLPFLIHWTRRRVGPWPDQSQEEFLDDLIFQTPRSDHSPLGCLCRILAGQSIVATNDLTRDKQPVVCFSEMDLASFVNRRVFRPHLSRWDFEPYGIAFDRDWLAERFAKPVIYGDESDWETLPSHQTPYYQLRRSKTGNIDWTVEREWRGLGNLDLSKVPTDAALVFVENPDQLSVVSQFSRWPIVALRPSVEANSK